MKAAKWSFSNIIIFTTLVCILLQGRAFFPPPSIYLFILVWHTDFFTLFHEYAIAIIIYFNAQIVPVAAHSTWIL